MKKGQPLVYPAAILDKRITKRNNQAVTQLLVQWSNLAPESATWEDYSFLVSQFPDFDPWGQGSIEGRGNVMKARIDELEQELMTAQTKDEGMENSRMEGSGDLTAVKKKY